MTTKHAACCCPDPLREVHPGCPLHGHSPEAYIEPAATCDGQEWRDGMAWDCQLPRGHKAPDGTFLGRPCKGKEARNV